MRGTGDRALRLPRCLVDFGGAGGGGTALILGGHVMLFVRVDLNVRAPVGVAPRHDGDVSNILDSSGSGVIIIQNGRSYSDDACSRDYVPRASCAPLWWYSCRTLRYSSNRFRSMVGRF